VFLLFWAVSNNTILVVEMKLCVREAGIKLDKTYLIN
jgi:hypothetical protein